MIENLKFILSFLDDSFLSLNNDEKTFISSLIPPQLEMTKLFANGNFLEYKAAVENKKAALIICKTDKTSFGYLIADQIIFGRWSSSSLICAFNI